MTKARENADNVTGDISAVTAGSGLTGGGTSGAVTVSLDTTVAATTNNTLTMSAKTLSAPTLSGTVTASGDIVLSATNGPGSITDELTLLTMGAL